MESNIYVTALRLCPGIGNKALCTILNFFEDAQTAWNFIPEHYNLIGWSDKQLDIFLNHKKHTSLDKIQETIIANSIYVMTIYDEEYPDLLKEIPNPPAVLFLRGRTLERKFAIAVVGSRRPTAYGKVIAEQLAEDLAANNITVVSGMARGIDTLAHKGALLKGDTIAVLGCGVDVIYPRENAGLFKDIINNGTVISEFPPGTPPEPGHFPARNRIISGLAKGVLVVEAAQKSGSLITADFALEQGRDVFAVPGPITNKNSAGCHFLIKNGAKLVSDINDILEEYHYEFITNNNLKDSVNLKKFTPEEKQIMEIINYQPLHFEEILEKTKIKIGILSKILTQLEINSDIRQLPGQYYVLDKVNMG